MTTTIIGGSARTLGRNKEPRTDVMGGVHVSCMCWCGALPRPRPGAVQLGLFPKTVSRRQWVGHDGNYGGYESEHWFDNSRGLTLTVVNNRDESDSASDSVSNRLWLALARVVDASAQPAWGPC